MAALCADVFISKLRHSAFLLLYSSIPVFPFLTLHVPLSFANFSYLRKKLAGVRIVVVFFFFSNFRMYQRLFFFWFWPLKGKFQILVLDFSNLRRWRGTIPTMMESGETRNYVSTLCASRHHLKNLHPDRTYWLNRSRCNKMRGVFPDRKKMLIFRIGLRSCQVLVIFV